MSDDFTLRTVPQGTDAPPAQGGGVGAAGAPGINETAELLADLLAATGLIPDDKLALARGRAGAFGSLAQALVESRIAGLNPLSHETRVIERFYYSGAVEVQPDKQGRVMLPPALVEHGGLGREVVVVGMRDRLEIWDRAAWRTQLKEVMGNAEHVAERLAAQHN